MLEGLMQHDHPLSLQLVLERMRGMNGDAEVVTLTEDGATRTTYAEVGDRVDRLCRGLQELGVEAGDRVATFSWNSQYHLEAYLAAPCMGAVLHTLNIRLFPEQLVYIVNHAQDKVILVDALLVDALAQHVDQFETVEHYVVMGDGATSRSCRTRSATRSCSRARSRASTTRRSTTGRRPGSATRAGRPATRRASSTRTARTSSTRWASAWRTGSGSAAPTASSRWCRCSTPTRGGCPTRRAWRARA